MENIFKNENWKEFQIKDALDSSKQKIYISDFGRVRIRNYDLETFRLSDLTIQKGFYVFTYRNKIGDYKTFPVHRAVASSFVKKDGDRPFCLHKDYNRHNNHFRNLKWVNYLEMKKFHENRYMYYIDKKKENPASNFSDEALEHIKKQLDINATYETILKLAKQYNTTTTQISRVHLIEQFWLG